MPSHVERLAIDPFAIRLIGPPEPRVLGLQPGTAHQRWEDKLKSVLGQAARVLLLRIEPGREPEKLLGRLVGIRYDNDMSQGRTLRLDEQTFTKHPIQYRPAHLEHTVLRSLSHQGGIGIVAEPLHPSRQPCIHGPDNSAKSLAVIGDRGFVSLFRRSVVFPEPCALYASRLNLPVNESVRSVHKPRGKSFFLPFQRPGARKGRYCCLDGQARHGR